MMSTTSAVRRPDALRHASNDDGNCTWKNEYTATERTRREPGVRPRSDARTACRREQERHPEAGVTIARTSALGNAPTASSTPSRAARGSTPSRTRTRTRPRVPAQASGPSSPGREREKSGVRHVHLRGRTAIRPGTRTATPSSSHRAGGALHDRHRSDGTRIRRRRVHASRRTTSAMTARQSTASPDLGREHVGDANNDGHNEWPR